MRVATIDRRAIGSPSISISTMTFALAASLTGLALIDSTSFGTLLIPIWLMLAPERIAVRRLLLFLGTVGVFYFVVGIALLLGADAWADRIGPFLDTPVVAAIQLGVGVALVIASFRMGGGQGSGRLMRWRDAAASGASGSRALVGLALAAAVLEVATMLPYLGAIALLTTSDMGLATSVSVLAGYCLVMILPAIVLLGARTVAARAVEPTLRRISTWIQAKGANVTAWTVGIVGFLVARDALITTDLIDHIAG